MKPLGKVKIEWSPDFAYAIGLIVSDGNLSPDGRHVVFTSKDSELIDKFQQSLKIKIHIGRKASGALEEKKYYVVQISDVLFYRFLLGIGLMPKKSKIIWAVKMPDEYFFDFLRGSFDGDGSSYSYWDSRWRSSFMFYMSFVSASQAHIDWLQHNIMWKSGISGSVNASGRSPLYQLRYAKTESLKLFRRLYYNDEVICLSRKRFKLERAFQIDVANRAREW